MKKQILALISLSLLSLAGCTIRNSPSALPPSENRKITEKILIIDNYPLTAYYQYESLDLSDRVVSSLSLSGEDIVGEKETITDYIITDEEQNIVQDKQRLPKEGTFRFTLSKEGYTSCFFDVDVYPSSSFKETLNITSLPKTSYEIGDTFSSDGLLRTKKTEFFTEEGKKSSSAAVIDYQLTIDGEQAEGYQFSDHRRHTLTISTPGLEHTLTAKLSLSAISKGNRFDKNDYPKDSVNWSSSTAKRNLSISNSAKENDIDSKTLYTTDEVKLKYTRKDFSLHNYYNWRYTPSTGNVPLLVIPIVRDGYEEDATEEAWERINSCFFGDSKDTSFESLRSYYYKSSFGQLNLTGGVTGYVSLSDLDSSRKGDNLKDSDTNRLAQLAFNWAEKTYNLNPEDFDTDKDGTIDARWMIYIHPIDQSSVYWGFTSTTSQIGTVEDPVVNTYGWAGLDFLDEYVYTGIHKDINDAHVRIHETGHRLGLSDYYSYSYQNYDPLGGKDRMDRNVFDQNPYSKRLLGWVTPNVVTGNVSSVDLYTSCQKDNSVLIVPHDSYVPEFDDEGKLLFNPFDEYLVIDCFSNRNRNKYGWDAYNRYPLSGQGGRVYHVDSRLRDGSSRSLVADSSSLFSGGLPRLVRAISNTEAGERAESNYGLTGCDYFDEIRLISGAGGGSYYNDYPLSRYHTFTDSDFFKENRSFKLSSFPNQFNGSTFNSGASCSYQVTFNRIPQD